MTRVALLLSLLLTILLPAAPGLAMPSNCGVAGQFGDLNLQVIQPGLVAYRAASAAEQSAAYGDYLALDAARVDASTFASRAGCSETKYFPAATRAKAAAASLCSKLKGGCPSIITG